MIYDEMNLCGVAEGPSASGPVVDGVAIPTRAISDLQSGRAKR
jgi:hypothetical protein